jgi:dihydrofolate reductase
LLGSANLSSTLQALNLIDEYRIMVNPILLGQGIPLFKPTDKRQKMELIKTKVFNSGNVLLYYKPK